MTKREVKGEVVDIKGGLPEQRNCTRYQILLQNFLDTTALVVLETAVANLTYDWDG